MASTSRTGLMFVVLLVASFCATANASRALSETSKLSLDGVTNLLDTILTGGKGPVKLAVTVDLTKVVGPVVIIVEDAVGGAVDLPVVVGVVTALKEPIEVVVSVDGILHIVVEALGQKVAIPLKLKALDPVLEAVTGVVAVVLTLVETVVDGLNVVQIVNDVGEILAAVTGAL